MTKAPESPKSRRGQLQITRERVVGIVVRIIETEGLEAAQAQFKTMNGWFCTEQGCTQ